MSNYQELEDVRIFNWAITSDEVRQFDDWLPVNPMTVEEFNRLPPILVDTNANVGTITVRKDVV